MKRLFKKIKLNRLLCALLCICMMMSLMPLTAFAEGKGDNGYDTTLDSTYKIDGNDVFVYITGTGGKPYSSFLYALSQFLYSFISALSFSTDNT